MIFCRFQTSIEASRAINRDRTAFESMLRSAICKTRSIYIEPRDIIISVDDSITVEGGSQQIISCEARVLQERWTTPTILGLMLQNMHEVLCSFCEEKKCRVIVMIDSDQARAVLDSDPTPEPESILTRRS